MSVREIVAVRTGRAPPTPRSPPRTRRGCPPPYSPTGTATSRSRPAGGSSRRRSAPHWHGTSGPRDPAPYCARRICALETARLALGTDRPRIDERLRDRETGILELLNETAIHECYPEEYARRVRAAEYTYRPPGGESLYDVTMRLRGLLADLGWTGIPLRPTGPPSGRALLVAHDAVVLMLRHIIDGPEPDGSPVPPVANASISVWNVQDGRLRRQAYSETG